MNRLNTLRFLFQNKIKCFILFGLMFLLSGCKEDSLCPTIQTYMNIGIGDGADSCLLCPIFGKLIDTSKDMAVNAWEKLAKVLIPVVGIGSAIYIAIYTLKLLGTFGKQTANDYMTGGKTGLLIFMFKAAFIVFLLSGGSGQGIWSIITGNNKNFLIQKIISPILQSGLEIGGKLAVASGNELSFDFYLNEGIVGEIRALLSSPWGPLFEMIRQAVYGFNSVTYEPVAVGQAMICNATQDDIFKWYYLMLVYGFILFIFGWLLTLGIAFYIVDILINLMFAAIMLPVAVACAISNQTVTYTKKVWDLFMNVFFNFVMLGIVLGLCMRIIDLCLGHATSESGGGSAIIETGGALANIATNYQALFDANEVGALSEALWSNGNLLITVVCLSIATLLVTQMKKLAEKVSGTASFNDAGSRVSAAAGQMSMKAGKKVGTEVYERGKPAVQNASKTFSRMARLDKLSNWSNQQANIARGFMTGRGPEGHRAFWRR